MARCGFMMALAALAALALWACSSKDEPRTWAPEPGHSGAEPSNLTRPDDGPGQARGPRQDPDQNHEGEGDGEDEGGEDASCLVDQGGCRAAATEVPPCAGDSSIQPIALSALLANPRAHADKVIAVKGPLVKNGAGCTERACKLTCCNTCSSIITLGQVGSEEHVRLESAAMPGQYVCRGDESLVCCQLQARGQTVIAQGTFQIAPSTTPPVYQLWVSDLCAPAAP